MEVDGNVDGRTDGFAHGCNEGHDSFNARWGFDEAHRIGEGGGFERGKALFDALAGGLGREFWCRASGRPIDADSFRALSRPIVATRVG